MRKSRIVIALLLIPALVIAAWALSGSRTFQVFGEIVPRVDTSKKVIALTFDDGPAAEATDQVLSVLRERGVKATFFLIGAELEQRPELGRKIAREGHELGNHSYTHKRMVLKTPSFIRDEIERTDRLIRGTGYQGPIHFRPPNCKKLLLLPYYLSETGRKTITWDIEPDSYPEVAREARGIEDYVLERARPGSIVLLHVMYKSREESLRAVAGIIDRLRERGYEFATVSDLMASE